MSAHVTPALGTARSIVKSMIEGGAGIRFEHSSSVIAEAIRLTLADLQAAEDDRDALLGAIGFKPGPLDQRDARRVILDDASGLRPAMVKARRERDAAEGRLLHAQAFAAEEIRAWVKERFGKWITHRTADGLRKRLFAKEAAV